MVIDLTDKLDTYMGRGIPKARLAYSYVFFLPETISLVLPVAVLFAVVFTVGALGRHSELVAAKASGVSVYRVVGPLLAPSPPAGGVGLGVRRVARGPVGRAQGARRDALCRAGPLRRCAVALRLGYEEAAGGAGAEAVGAVRVHHHRAVRGAARDLHAAQRDGVGRGGVPRHDL